jgi:uncharacterized protein (TIGR02597 family)
MTPTPETDIQNTPATGSENPPLAPTHFHNPNKKSSNSMRLKSTLLTLAAAAVLAALPLANAQNVTATTDPVGFVTTNITASSDGVNFATTFVSPVLLQASSVNGTTSGTLSGATSTTVSVASAGWTTDQLSSSQAYFMLKSGNATGTMLRVSTNTADTATIDALGADLTALGVASGDSFQLIEGDTVLTMFGTPSNGVIGGNSTKYSSSQTDRVVIRDISGNLRTLYYNTDSSKWLRSGSSSDQGSIPISPYAGVYYSRIATTPLSIVTTGSVPTQSIKLLVPATGSAFFARVFPTEGTLSGLGFQNLSGWTNTSQSGITTSNVDRVVTVDASGTLRSFYYTGTQWRRAGSSSDQSSTTIPVSGAVYTVRQSSGTTQPLAVTIPYSL